MRLFFCKYADPPPVRLEKLSIITSNYTAANASSIIAELAEYCCAADPSFACASVIKVGELALKIEACAPRCVDVPTGLTGAARAAAIAALAGILRQHLVASSAQLHPSFSTSHRSRVRLDGQQLRESSGSTVR
jgi:hypothetical protein